MVGRKKELISILSHFPAMHLIDDKSAPIKCLNLFRFINMDAIHEPHHLASGHLGIDALLFDLSVFRLTKDTSDIPVFRLQIFLNAFGGKLIH